MKAAPAPTYLMFTLRGIEGESADKIAYAKKRGSLEYQILVDEVTILQIYRFEGDPSWRGRCSAILGSGLLVHWLPNVKFPSTRQAC